MKAFKIQDDIVAAFSVEQAIEIWAEHFGVEADTAGPVEELNPATFLVAYEQDDGSFDDGTLADMMPETEPCVLIDAEAEF